MGNNEQTIKAALLRRLAPISTLSEQGLEIIRGHARIETYAPGKILFRRGDQDGLTTYLLAGQVELLSEGNAHEYIDAVTEGIIRPLAQLQPRQFTATARTGVKVLQVERNLLDQMLALEESGSYQVVDLEQADDADDWMSLLLQSELFQRIPTTNVQKIFQHVEKVKTLRDEVIIRQGDPGDYYYFVAEGHCAVLHATASGNEVLLAELSPGDSFGEEALVSDARRNATVRMLTDGVLMRMTQQDFAELIKQPVLRTVTLAKAKAVAAQGGIWLDVRLEDEHAQGAIPGSRNVPLRKLRGDDSPLELGPVYIAYCDTGKRSAAAAFLMSEQGHDVCLLAGGLDANPDALTAPEEPPPVVGPLPLTVGTAQEIGKRAFQEDAFRIERLDKPGTALLAVIADGMGGHAAGDVASRLASDTFVDTIRRNYPAQNIPDLLRDALLRANAAIHDHASKHRVTKGMGCTLVAALIEGGRCWWVSVGDSHLYLLRGQGLRKVNADHSYSAHLKRMEASGKPVDDDQQLPGNMLMSALNGMQIPEVDLAETPLELQRRDRLLLATDGINALSEETLTQQSTWATTVETYVDNLLEAVAERDQPHQDNTTLIAIEVGLQPVAGAVTAPAPADAEVVARLNAQLQESSRQLALALRHKAESEAAQQKAEREAVEQRRNIEQQNQSDREAIETRIRRELEMRELQLKQASEALEEAHRQQRDDEQSRLAIEDRFERLRAEEAHKRKLMEAEADERLKVEQARIEEKLSRFSQQMEEVQRAREQAEERLAEEEQRTETRAREAAARLADAEQERAQAEQQRLEAEAQAEQARAANTARDAANHKQLKARQQEELANLEQRLAQTEQLLEATEQTRQQAEAEAAQRREQAAIAEAQAREQLEAQLRKQHRELEQHLAEAEHERTSAEQARQEAEALADRTRAQQAEEETQARRELEARQSQELADLEQRLARAEQAKENTEQVRLRAEAEAQHQLEEAAGIEVRERTGLEAQLREQQATLEQHLAEAERLRDEAERTRHDAEAEAQRQLAETVEAEAGVRKQLERELAARQVNLEQRLAEAEQVREAAEQARRQAEAAAREQLEHATAEEARVRERLETQLREQQAALEQRLAEAEQVREAAEQARHQAEETAREQLERVTAAKTREREQLEAQLRKQQAALERRLAAAEQAREKAEQAQQTATEEANHKLAAAARAEAHERETIERELAARQTELEQRLVETARLRSDAELTHQQATEEAKRQIQQLTEQEAEQRRQLEAELLQKQSGLEEQLAETARELESARTRQQRAEAERARSENEADRLRAENAAEQARLRHQAEVHLQAERERMELRFAETVDQLDALQRKHAEAENARQAAEEEIGKMRDSQQLAEARARQEAEVQLAHERQRIGVEIRESQRILGEARQQQQQAEQARAAAEEEAAIVRAEHEAAGDVLRTELRVRLEAERTEFGKRLEEANEQLRSANDKAQRAIEAETEATSEAARIRAAEEAARMQLQAEVEQQLRTEREMHAEQLAEASQRLATAEQAQLEADAKRRETETAAAQLQAAMQRAQADNEQERLQVLQAEGELLHAALVQSNAELHDAHLLVQSASVDRQLAERRADQLRQAEHDAAALKERARASMNQAREEVRRLELELAKARRKASEESGRTRKAEEARAQAEKEYARIKGSLEAARQVADNFRERDQLDREIRHHRRRRVMLPLLAGALLLAALGGGWYYRDRLPFAPMAEAPPAAPPSTAVESAASAVTPAVPTAPVVPSAATAAVVPEAIGTLRDKLRDGRDGPVMVRLPGATYMMGDTTGSGQANERPAHSVTLRPFAIGRFEVSFAEYEVYVRATDRARPGDQAWGRGSNPVINVSWRDANAYADWLSAQTGQRYRLPTEAEWEFAARGGTTTGLWWNQYDEEAYALCTDCDIRSLAPGRTVQVGSFPPNPFGLHQTAGNVQEWVADCYHASYRGAPGNGRAWTTGGCASRVVRGGTFLSPRWLVRSSARAHLPPNATSFDTGFRLVREE